MRFFLAAFFFLFFLFSGQINIHAFISTTPENRIRAQNFFFRNCIGAERPSSRKPCQLQALHSDNSASGRCEIRYTYDKASRISTVTIPAQHRELRYVYDGRGNKVNIYIRDTQNNRFTMQAFEYDALNRLTYAYSEYYGEVHIEYFDAPFTSTEELRRRVTYPSGIKAEFYHDAFDRPIRIAWLKDDNQIMAHSYEYDSFDRIIRKTVDSPSGQRQENYSFDLADRLIAALTPEGTINYDYDQNDNLTSIYHSGNTERQVNFATDGQYQELLTGASYPAFGRSFTFGLDALGRRITDKNISNNALHIRTYAFDPMSRLSAVSSVKAPLPNAEPWPAEELEYSYLPGSPLRHNLTKQQPAQTTKRHFIWDGANELESLSEFTASGNTDYFAEIFLSDPAIMDKRFGAAKNPNAFVDDGAEGIDYITDQQNTINASYKGGNITDEQHFSPYGKPVTFTLPEGTELTKFAYTGRNYDAPADLYYYRGRYYDACSARFLNPDPSENGLNWTGYVGGDPVNMVDPSGYFIETPLDLAVFGADLTMASLFGAASLFSDNPFYRKNFEAWTMAAAIDGLAVAVPGAPGGLGSAGAAAVTLGRATKMGGIGAAGAIGSSSGNPFGLPAYMFKDNGGNRGQNSNVCGSTEPTERHHLLPQKYKDRFKKAGLNIENFIYELPRSSHRLKPGGLHTGKENWNKQWKIFFEEFRNPSPEDILEQLTKMKKAYGLE